MTDHQFLKENRIEPCDIAEPRWMAWRSEEIQDLRGLTIRQGDLISALCSDLKRWKAVAALGWLFAAMLFAIPIIERMGQ